MKKWARTRIYIGQRSTPDRTGRLRIGQGPKRRRINVSKDQSKDDGETL